MVRALDLQLKYRWFESRPFCIQASCSQTCASVTKQYNLIPVKGRCPAAEKVTVGLASHWPRVTDISGLSTYGQPHGLRKVDKHPACTRDRSLALLFNCNQLYRTFILRRDHADNMVFARSPPLGLFNSKNIRCSEFH